MVLLLTEGKTSDHTCYCSMLDAAMACARLPAGLGLTFEHGPVHPSERLFLAYLEPATRRFAEHAENGRPRDDAHDRPATWLGTDVYGMGGCRRHPTHCAGPGHWRGSR
jgi:hypothetical protein